MAYFHNRTINLLNLHSAISMAALSGGGAFVAAYLLKAGLSVPAVMLSFCAIFGFRLVIRSGIVVLGARFGLRRLFIFGAIGLGLQFPLVAEVHGLNWALYAMIAASAVCDTVYWPVFHAYFAAQGDEDHRGQQLSLREAISATVGIASPLATGWLLVTFGPRAAFGVSALIQILSALPLIWLPDVPIARRAPGAFRAAWRGAILFMADGWVAAGYNVAWQIALFLLLGENFFAYGGALAIAALAGGAGGLLLGRYIDAGQGGRAAWIAIATISLVILLRAGVHDHPALAIAANALGALANCLYIPTVLTAVYNQAKRSPCPLRFQAAAEGGWDIGIASGCGFAALLVWSGLPLSLAILSALLGAGAVLIQLRRYFAAHPSEIIDASLEAQALEVPRM